MTQTTMNTNEIRSSCLVSKQTFVSGMGSVFNLRGSYFNYNYSKSALEADQNALKRDWAVVGNAISRAINLVIKK